MNRGDKDAFADLFNTYYDRLFLFARKFIAAATAEDILSETFVKLWARAGQFESLPATEQWLRVTVRNACIDALRKEKRMEDREKEYGNLTDASYEEQYFRSSLEAELFGRILHQIDQLPPQTRNIIQLFFFQGLSVDEIALKLNIGKQVVYNKKSLGLKELRLSLPGNEMILFWLIATGFLR